MKELDAARRFALFAWCVLGWNVFVVLWGAFVRATGSGAGCGSHWPLCNGAVIPPAPSTRTVIEFTHRLTSGAALLAVVTLWVWSRRIWTADHPARRCAWASFVFIVLEALLGAGLVLLQYVEKNASAGRVLYLCAHLTNTLLLLAAIASSAWHAGHEPRWRWRSTPAVLRAALAAALLASLTGAVAALGDTVYPAISMLEGVQAEFAAGAPALLRLRLIHPVVAVLSSALILLAAFQQTRGRLQHVIAVLAAAQLAAGAVNVLLLAPVWMQILHLALAAGLWLALVIAALACGPSNSIMKSL